LQGIIEIKIKEIRARPKLLMNPSLEKLAVADLFCAVLIA